jgi:sugar/nucleoside kinase (ribokinase family)
MKVLCIGHASYDISIPVKEYPKENTKYRLESKFECGGGPAANAAYLLGKWKVNTYFQGVVGNDVYGKRLVDEFKNIGVNTEYMEKTNEEDTSLSFILINEKNGSRTLFNIGKKQVQPKKFNYNFTPDIILVDGNNYEAAIKAFELFPDAIKVIDAGRITKELLNLCSMVDYLICSKGFAETVTKSRINYDNPVTLKNVFKLLEKTYGNAKIVITLEEKGCLYKLDDKMKLMKGLKFKAIDTTGAGDIFHGAFVYGLAKRFTYEKCLKIANIAGGLSVTKMGSRTSIPELKEVIKIYEKD